MRAILSDLEKWRRKSIINNNKVVTEEVKIRKKYENTPTQTKLTRKYNKFHQNKTQQRNFTIKIALEIIDHVINSAFKYIIFVSTSFMWKLIVTNGFFPSTVFPLNCDKSILFIFEDLVFHFLL